MIDGLTFVLIGMLIGAIIPFVAGWVTFDRNLHELIAESQALRKEAQGLRNLAASLAGEVEKKAEAEKAVARKEIDLFEESISSFAIEREIAGLVVSRA